MTGHLQTNDSKINQARGPSEGWECGQLDQTLKLLKTTEFLGKHMHYFKKRICKNRGVLGPVLPINQRNCLSFVVQSVILALTAAAHEASVNSSRSLQTSLAGDLFLLGQLSPELGSLAPSCAGPSLR